MKDIQRVIKYIAIVFACFLIITIFSGIIRLIFSFTTITFDKEYDYTTVDELKITDDIDTLVLNIGNSDLNIKVGNSLNVDTNNQYIRVSTIKNKLVIKEINHGFLTKDNSDITIYLPENFIFNSTDIETGAGKIKIEKLVSKDLEIDLGAGTAYLDNIEAINEADIETGAGSVTINNSIFNNLDLDLGVGKVLVNASILGKSSIDSGVGALQINLLGDKNDYEILASKGIGSFKIDGNNVLDNSTYGKGNNNIKITGGVGSIKVDFDNSSSTYIKTYTVLNKVKYQEENKYYVTLQESQGSVETVIIEDIEDILKEDKTFEFKFNGVKSNDIKENFNNELIEFSETNKTGLNQIN